MPPRRNHQREIGDVMLEDLQREIHQLYQRLTRLEQRKVERQQGIQQKRRSHHPTTLNDKEDNSPTVPAQTIIGISLIEVLSSHASDEVYLGERASGEWARDDRVIEAFNRFGSKLKEIEAKIQALNRDPGLKNRSGPAQVPYTLLVPSSEGGITAKGIPNSISI